MGRRMRVVVVAVALTAAGCGSSGDDTASQNEFGAAGESVPSSVSAAASGSAAPDASPYVAGFGDISIVSFPAGEPGEVVVVAAGTNVDRRGSVTIVVRNNTGDAVGNIEVAGTARDDAGSLVGSGSSQGLQPKVVAPGEIAYGYVYFDTAMAGETFEFGFSVDPQPAGEFFAPLTVTEINNTGSQIVGAAANDTDGDVSGPISADVICFESDGSILDTFQSFVEQNNLAAGAAGSFAIDLLGRDCPAGLVGASGYTF